MEGNFPSKDDNPNKTTIHSSNSGQSMPVKKAFPRIEKLRTESLPMSPLSLNGSLTTVDVCDTSFGKKVIRDMTTTNAEIPDESFSEEVLQDMDYSLDALRDAVPVLCLKKNDDSCEDTDIFEEMSAYQVMGIFNNKSSQKRDQVGNRQKDKNSELKNKRNFPDKNIDVLYQNTGNKDNPNRNDKLECTKHTGKKMDENEINNLMQDNEKDINNNDNECPMEATDSSTNGCDLIQNKDNVNLSEKDSCIFKNSQGKETNKEICHEGESLGSEEVKKSLCKNENNINVDDKIETSSIVNGKNTVIENKISNLCNKEECKEEFSQKNESKDSALHSNMAENKSFQKDTLKDENKCIGKIDMTVQDELNDKSEITNLNDSMRQIVADFIKQLPSSSENFLVRVEPIKECPMCYFKFNYQHFIFSTKTGAYTTTCECQLTIYILFEESLHLLKEYHNSSDASCSFTNVSSLDSEIETSSPMVTENKKKYFSLCSGRQFSKRKKRIETSSPIITKNKKKDFSCSGRQLSKRKNRSQIFLFNDSDDESLEYEDDSDDSYVP